MVRVAEGAEVKATCHLRGDGNRSQARQAHHQVIRGKEEGGGVHTRSWWGEPPWRPRAAAGPWRPPLSLLRVSGMEVRERAVCGSWVALLSEPKSQGPSVAGEFQSPRIPSAVGTLATEARRCRKGILWGLPGGDSGACRLPVRGQSEAPETLAPHSQQ